MYTVEIIFPKNPEALEKKYSEALADIVSEKLTTEELGYLISELEKQKN